MMWSGNSRDTMLNSVPEKKLRPKPTSEMGHEMGSDQANRL